MKPIKLSKEELKTLKQIEAWEKLEKIATGNYKIFAKRQYRLWCEVFLTKEYSRLD